MFSMCTKTIREFSSSSALKFPTAACTHQSWSPQRKKVSPTSLPWEADPRHNVCFISLFLSLAAASLASMEKEKRWEEICVEKKWQEHWGQRRRCSMVGKVPSHQGWEHTTYRGKTAKQSVREKLLCPDSKPFAPLVEGTVICDDNG